jgi:hypothetical protein
MVNHAGERVSALPHPALLALVSVANTVANLDEGNESEKSTWLDAALAAAGVVVVVVVVVVVDVVVGVVGVVPPAVPTLVCRSNRVSRISL